MLLVAAALAAPLTPAEVASPRGGNSWVADVSNVLPPDAELRINARIDALQRDLSVEIAVVTVPDVEGTPREFATELLNRWGVGAAEANNGVLLLLVTEPRRVELEVGYGLEGLLPDAAAGALLDRAVVPRFKEGDFAQGLEDGVAAIDAVVRAAPEEARRGTGGAVAVPGGGGAEAGARPEGGRSEGGGTLLAGGAAGVVVAGGAAAAWLLAERRRRQCPTCRKEMLLLDEAADDAHLTPGQRAEERVGSVNYEVRTCLEHDQLVVLPRRAWFSGFGHCPRCGSRTARSRTTTLRAATQLSEGLAEVITYCEHCAYHDRSRRTIPRRPPPSTHRSSGGGFGGGSGGGRSGGSFSGGRSGGGGAGRSF